MLGLVAGSAGDASIGGEARVVEEPAAETHSLGSRRLGKDGQVDIDAKRRIGKRTERILRFPDWQAGSEQQKYCGRRHSILLLNSIVLDDLAQAADRAVVQVRRVIEPTALPDERTRLGRRSSDGRATAPPRLVNEAVLADIAAGILPMERACPR